MISATRLSVLRPVADAACCSATVDVVVGCSLSDGTASICWRCVVVVRSSRGSLVVVGAALLGLVARVVTRDVVVVAALRRAVVEDEAGAATVVVGAAVVLGEVTLVGGVTVMVELGLVVVVLSPGRITWAATGLGTRATAVTTTAPAAATSLGRRLRSSIAGMVGRAALTGTGQRWWCGHDHEVRPPMVRRTRAVPSRGQ